MECFVQWLDDFEDLFYALALKWERIRRIFKFALFIATSGLFQVLAVVLALYYPPIASAVAALLLVGMLYRNATGPRPYPVSAA